MVVGFKYDEAAGFTYLRAAAIRAEESRITAPRCLASEGQTADLPNASQAPGWAFSVPHKSTPGKQWLRTPANSRRVAAAKENTSTANNVA